MAVARTVHVMGSPVKHGAGITLAQVLAYMMREAVRDSVGETLHNYRNHKSNQHVLLTSVSNAMDPTIFVRAGDSYEMGKRPTHHDGIPGYRFKLHLPQEIAHAGLKEIQAYVTELQKGLKNALGLESIAVVHSPEDGEENYHVHMIVLLRSFDNGQFAKKKSVAFDKVGFSSKERKNADGTFKEGGMTIFRRLIAETNNRHMESLGHSDRYDHRSYYARGLPLLRTWHEGSSRTAIRREGQPDDYCRRNDLVKEYNEFIKRKMDSGEALTAKETTWATDLFTKIDDLSLVLREELEARRKHKKTNQKPISKPKKTNAPVPEPAPVKFDRYAHVDTLEAYRRQIIAKRLAEGHGATERILTNSSYAARNRNIATAKRNERAGERKRAFSQACRDAVETDSLVKQADERIAQLKVQREENLKWQKRTDELILVFDALSVAVKTGDFSKINAANIAAIYAEVDVANISSSRRSLLEAYKSWVQKPKTPDKAPTPSPVKKPALVKPVLRVPDRTTPVQAHDTSPLTTEQRPERIAKPVKEPDYIQPPKVKGRCR